GGAGGVGQEGRGEEGAGETAGDGAVRRVHGEGEREAEEVTLPTGSASSDKGGTDPCSRVAPWPWPSWPPAPRSSPRPPRRRRRARRRRRRRTFAPTAISRRARTRRR